MKLEAFFSWYGSKHSITRYYPAPVCGRVVEPFAGSAAYACRYWDRAVRLYDADPVIAGVWQYLIGSGEDDVLALPSVVGDVRDLKVCQEAKWLIGLWLHRGAARPAKKPVKWMRQSVEAVAAGDTNTRHFQLRTVYWGEEVKRKIASQLRHIRHWKCFNRPWTDVPDRRATYFVDPPYVGKPGKCYVHSGVDYKALGEWCRSRRGQVIACDGPEADYLPFRPFVATMGTNGKKKERFSREMVWTRSDVQEGLGLL